LPKIFRVGGGIASVICAVVQLPKALRYKPEGGGSDFRRGHWNFHWLNPFLMSIHPLTEMIIRDISWA